MKLFLIIASVLCEKIDFDISFMIYLVFICRRAHLD